MNFKNMKISVRYFTVYSILGLMEIIIEYGGPGSGYKSDLIRGLKKEISGNFYNSRVKLKTEE